MALWVARAYLFSIMLFLCTSLGFITAYWTNYNADRGKNKVEELILLTHGSCYHIHHWMWIMALIACVFFGRCVQNRNLVYACVVFLVGMSLEDLLFKDWFEVRNNCHNKKVVRLLDWTLSAHP